MAAPQTADREKAIRSMSLDIDADYRGKWRVNARLVKIFRFDVPAKRRADAIRVLAVSRVQPFHGETGRTRSFTIELRGARAKEADCIRPTSWFAP